MKDHPPIQPARSVNIVERLGPTHARGLDRLVGIYSTVRQGEPFEDMQLDFDLSCGVAPLRISGQNFELGLRTCFVSLQRQNCDMHVGSRYEHWLEAGAFKASEVQKTTTARSQEAGAKLNVDIDATSGIAGFVAKLGLGASRKRDAKSEALTEQNARIELVVTSGQDRWRVGDLARGDARRPDGILSGDYFREEKTRDGDPVPLCRLGWVDQTAPARITITVTASFGSLLIFAPDRFEADESIARGARTTLKQRSRLAMSEHDDALRARVAGLVGAKTIRNAQKKAGVDVLDNEFMIVCQTIIASPEDLPAVTDKDK